MLFRPIVNPYVRDPGIGRASKGPPDVTMTVDSGSPVDLLNEDVWYSELVDDGRRARQIHLRCPG